MCGYSGTPISPLAGAGSINGSCSANTESILSRVLIIIKFWQLLNISRSDLHKYRDFCVARCQNRTVGYMPVVLIRIS